MGNVPNTLKDVVAKLIYCPACRWLGRAVVGVTFVSLSATLSSRFYWEPQLKVGSLAVRDIYVLETTTVEDSEAMRQSRERARQAVPPVYKLDPKANEVAGQHLEQAIVKGEQFRRLVGPLPYLSIAILTLETQIYLRSCSDAELARIRQLVDAKQELSQELPAVVRELQKLPPVKKAEIWEAIAAARQQYQLGRTAIRELPPPFLSQFFDVSDADWQADKETARRMLDDLLAAGLVSGIPEELRQYRLRSHHLLPTEPKRRMVLIALLNQSFVPNLTPDLAATERKADAASAAVDKTVVLYKGEVLVRAGHIISDRDFALLDRLGLTQRQPNFLGMIAVTLTVGLAIAIFVWVNRQYAGWLNVRLRNRDLAAIGILCTGAALTGVLLSSGGMAFFPLASLGLMLGSFYGFRLATLTTVLVVGLLAVGIGAGFVGNAPIIVGAIVAAMLTNRPHTRSQLALTGIFVAATQVGVCLITGVVTGGVPSVDLLASALQYATGGLFSSIVALGAIPYLELLTYALTPIRLAELANLDRPLLRRLVTEAPGTFQHTLFVANLAEAAARALGADTALVRTGTLYHDIGKTLHPEFFIENQMGQPNPHDLLDDPWRSAEIIKEHVTGGIKLAQKHRLPDLLQSFIPEHQGTIAINYFYYQAMKRSPYVVESDFRYDGPIPQSRETGIVMLADACEAALRSLGVEATLDEANEMVMRILQSRWADGQLADSGLTPNDLDRIAGVFIQVWRERNHGRIKYPAFAKKLDPTGASLPEKVLPDKVLVEIPVIAQPIEK